MEPLLSKIPPPHNIAGLHNVYIPEENEVIVDCD